MFDVDRVEIGIARGIQEEAARRQKDQPARRAFGTKREAERLPVGTSA